MLKYNRIIINISYRNIKNYLEKGYDAKLHVDLEVNICDLPNVSHQKVIAICQLCGVENEIQYHKYLINRNRHGYYGCKGCSRVKQNLTLNKLNKIPKIYEFKDIPLVDNLSLSKDQVLKKKNVKLRSWVEKDIEFLINNYSKLSSSQIAKSLNKSIRSIRGKAYKLGLSKCNWNDDEVKLLKLIYTNNSNREIAKILNRSYSAISGKAKKLKLRKSEEFLSKNRYMNLNISEFKQKSKKTIIELYNVDSYSRTKEFKEYLTKNKDEINQKIKQTIVLKYGVDHISKVEDVQKLIRETKIKNGVILPDDILSDWIIYKRNVRTITNRFKNELYDNWDGYDYYDEELIKDNKSYDSMHRFYPTVDHKISVHYGFINKIPEIVIGDISNLCITKRFLNCTKSSKIEIEFKI